MRARWQAISSGYDGLNHVSKPLCDEHLSSEAPAETVAVLEVFGDHECAACPSDEEDES